MTDAKIGPFVDTEDYEATQGHAPGAMSRGYGEWGFVFYDSRGFELSRFLMNGFFADAKATAEQMTELESLQGTAVIKVVA